MLDVIVIVILMKYQFCFAIVTILKVGPLCFLRDVLCIIFYNCISFSLSVSNGPNKDPIKETEFDTYLQTQPHQVRSSSSNICKYL